ncbi:hypothetical protein GOP47_0005960 [Adiantum capillus-veneris]|uniref:Uncharacterized protein n=1 Tax=Adiantum capillus-veneris TaxID=13818 RepID=A0A9D4V2C2_ADICA|nr:hypothetical protein GOP47_0005960 [Adiantum capillus-veneris]
MKYFIGTGAILLSFPYEVIDYEVLGEEDLGVVVNKAYNEGTRTSASDSLDCITLVRWPIKRLTFQDGSPLLSKPFGKEFVDEDTGKEMDNVDYAATNFVTGTRSLFVHKRTYCMANMLCNKT